MLSQVLEKYWFTEKQAKIYLACLELWSSPVSSIARYSEIHRVTTHYILKELKEKNIARVITKNNVKYFSVISASELIKKEEEKINKLKSVLPELTLLWNKFDNKTKIDYYEWISELKGFYKQIILEWIKSKKPFLVFLWTQDIDYKMQEFFDTEFKKFREENPYKTNIILADSDNPYSKINEELHNSLLVKKDVFNLWIEIILYWENIALLSYNKKEIYWIKISSKVMKNSFESIFNLIWEMWKNK